MQACVKADGWVAPHVLRKLMQLTNGNKLGGKILPETEVDFQCKGMQHIYFIVAAVK